MTLLHLQPHPDTPADHVSAIAVQLTPHRLVFSVTGADGLVLPPPVVAERADGLWRTTCFELFVKPDGADSYSEFNFSPSTRWAAYRFDGYRTGMRALELAGAPVIERITGEASWIVQLPGDAFGERSVRIGLSAVIEELGARKSYWALGHPPGEPDFHHDACFAHPIAAPKAT